MNTHNIGYDLQFLTICILILESSNLHQSKVLLFGKGLTLTLPNNKILDVSKLKPFADDKINVTQKLKSAVGRIKNSVGKGENAGYQHFLLFPQCFQKDTFSESLNVETGGKGLKLRILWCTINPFPHNF